MIKADLDKDWGDNDQEDGPPMRSMYQAYADLLGLDLHEVGNLVEVEAELQDGHSGEMIYSYILDFTDYASPEVAREILQHHALLRIKVGPDYFENVRSND